jgi:outer membrane protein OmpA-like peptidoglycan-associated protein
MKMMSRRKYLGTTLALAILAGGFVVSPVLQSAVAGELSTQQIIDGLKPKTRSLSASTRASLSEADAAFVQRVRGQSRSLSLDDRQHMAEIAAKRPKIDVEINFDFNSAELTPRAEPQLNSLGKALTSSELAGTVVMLGGHTDAKGTDDYNQKLSERRAETVKRFLIDNYKVSPDLLVTSGYGKAGLKNSADPFAAENRRVEIVNMVEKEQAAK